MTDKVEVKEVKQLVDTDLESKSAYYHEENPCKLCGMKWEDDPIGDCQVKLLEHYRDSKVEMSYYESVLKNLHNRIKAATKLRMVKDGEVGEVVKIDGATITIVTPKKPRVTWNSAGLDGYAVANPDVLQFRVEKWSEPSIRVKID